MEDTARKMISDLLQQGINASAESRQVAEGTTGVDLKKAETLAKYAFGYLEAAETLLHAFPTLHNELIDHKDFVQMRHFRRNFGR